MTIDNLSADEIDELIFRLAKRRNELDPIIPMKIDDLAAAAGATYHHQNDPSMAIAPHHESNGIRLMLRSGGLGWMEFAITQSNAIALRDWLLNRYGNEGISIFSKSGSGQNLPV